MIIPHIDTCFTYQHWADHATVTTVLPASAVADGLAVVAWCEAQFDADQQVAYDWLEHRIVDNDQFRVEMRWSFQLELVSRLERRSCHPAWNPRMLTQPEPWPAGCWLGIMLWHPLDITLFRLAFNTAPPVFIRSGMMF
jgi:hypothetical protein